MKASPCIPDIVTDKSPNTKYYCKTNKYMNIMRYSEYSRAGSSFFNFNSPVHHPN